MKNHLEKCNIILDEIYQDDNYNIPPWKLCTPTVDLTLHSTTKNESSKSDYKQRFLERKDFYEKSSILIVPPALNFDLPFYVPRIEFEGI